MGIKYINRSSRNRHTCKNALIRLNYNKITHTLHYSNTILMSSFLIESLEISDYDILHKQESRETQEDGDLDLFGDETMPVFYSFPFYSTNNLDYQYKIFFEGDYLVLQEIKSNDLHPNIEESEIVLKEHIRIESQQGLHLLSENIDLRNMEENKILEYCPTWGDILQTDLSTFSKQDAQSALENNKVLVLKDLYKHIIENPF